MMSFDKGTVAPDNKSTQHQTIRRRVVSSHHRQIMNLLQMTVLAGSPGGFLPNMYPGTLAASLARVILTSAGGSWAGEEAAAAEANDLLASKVQKLLFCSSD